MDVLATLLNILGYIFSLMSMLMVGYMMFLVIRHTLSTGSTPSYSRLLFLALVFLSVSGILVYAPQALIRSWRLGLERARPESELLREEFRYWLPDSNEIIVTDGSGGIPSFPTPIPQPLPTASIPAVYGLPPGNGSGVADPLPTVPLLPTVTAVPTATPQPTATQVPTIDVRTWNVLTPAPTPLVK